MEQWLGCDGDFHFHFATILPAVLLALTTLGTESSAHHFGMRAMENMTSKRMMNDNSFDPRTKIIRVRFEKRARGKPDINADEE